MNAFQAEYLKRTIQRLQEIMERTQHRCFEYKEDSLPRTLDIAIVEHVGVALYQLERFERRVDNLENKDELLACLKDAILQLHELNTFLDEHINQLEPFQEKMIEKENSWVRMLNMSLTSFFMNVCMDNIRFALQEIDKNLYNINKLDAENDRPIRQKPALRIVK